MSGHSSITSCHLTVNFNWKLVGYGELFGSLHEGVGKQIPLTRTSQISITNRTPFSPKSPKLKRDKS